MLPQNNVQKSSWSVSVLALPLVQHWDNPSTELLLFSTFKGVACEHSCMLQRFISRQSTRPDAAHCPHQLVFPEQILEFRTDGWRPAWPSCSRKSTLDSRGSTCGNVLGMARQYHLASACFWYSQLTPAWSKWSVQTRWAPASLRPWPCELGLQIRCTPTWSHDRQIDAAQVSAYEHAEYSKSSKHLNYSFVL